MNEPTLDLSAVSEDVWTISCSCGWFGEDWEDADDAQLEGDNHWDDEHWNT